MEGGHLENEKTPFGRATFGVGQLHLILFTFGVTLLVYFFDIFLLITWKVSI